MTTAYRLSATLFIFLLISLRLLVSEDLAINWDAPILIDGSYRVFSGQIPHIDFSTPIGPVIFMIGALGMQLGSPSLLGLNLGLILFSSGILIITLIWMRGCLSKNLLFFLAMYMAAFLYSPRMLSAKTLDYGYTGIYNLYGYAIFFLGALITFGDITSAAQKPKEIFWQGVFIGSLVVALLFLKNSFGFGLICLALVFLGLTKERSLFAAGMFGGVVAIGLLFAIYFDGNYIPIIRDQYFVVQARLEEHPFSRPDFFETFLKKTYIDNLYVIFAAIAGSAVMPRLRKRLISLGLSFLCLGYVFCAAIMQWPEHVLSSLMAFIVLCYLFQYQQIYDHHWKIRHSKLAMGLAAISMIFAIRLMVINVIGLISDAPRLIAKPMPTFNRETSREITVRSISPIVLRNYHPSERVIFVGENNLLSYQFQTAPWRNDLLFWQNQVTFTPNMALSNQYFDPEHIFQNVSMVVFSTKTHKDSVEAFQAIYGLYSRSL